jgi:uncharacterized protein (DUF1800 family)
MFSGFISSRVRRFAPTVCFIASLTGGILQAQTITIAPTGYITAAPGGQQQFTTAVTGDSGMSASVSWYVGGKAGGSSTVGTISSTGLYTAPMTPPASGQVQITAMLNGNSKISATTYIYMVAAGPPITSVSPNPIPVGTDLLTVTGTGFVKGAVIFVGGVQYGATFVNSTTLTTSIYQGSAASTTVTVKNSGSAFGNTLVVPVAGTSSGSGGGTGGTGGTVQAPVIAPAKVTVVLGATQQFTASGATTWSAVSGTVTATGLYKAPAAMPASGTDTVTAKNTAGQSAATVTLVSNVPPTISSIGMSPLPLGVFSTTVTGSGFTAASVAELNGVALTTTFGSASSITVSGFAGPGSSGSLTVANGAVVSQPFTVPIGVQNPVVSASAARRFLEQAAFGPTPADAAHVQTIGFQAWLTEQLAMPVISNYNAVTGSQGGLPQAFLANAVTNPDQLRQRVAFALSEIFVVSITKLIWNGDVIPFEQTLMADAFTNYRKILGDVTLNPGMGNYLDMANNAKANPVAGTAANENYAREVMQLFSLGDVLLNQDGSVQVDATGAPIPTYLQSNVTELARVFTGWTYAPQPGSQPNWGAYITENGPMVNYDPMHDFGSKTLLNGYVAPANLSTSQDLQAALDNIASHSNVAPFISKQLIQHLVKSNPTPAYVTRVANAFTQSTGDMPTVITAILLDPEARANDAGGNDQPTDGHLQEPGLFIPGFVRAFSGTMTTANYYSQTLASMGEDIYNPASVFNYFSPGYTVAGTGGLKGPEFQINNPNAAILRENLVAQFFNQYSNPVQSNGPGTLVDLTPFLPLANTPQALVSALDLTLTHGTMPAAMDTIVVNAVTADLNGALHRVQTAAYLILTSSYYNVWH